jgi:hypothetical protein
MAGSNTASGSHYQTHPERDMNPPKYSKPASVAAPKGWSAPTASASGLVSRIKNVMFSPKTEWEVIAPEPTTVAELSAGYVMPLAMLVALMGYLRLPAPGINPALNGLALTLMLFVSALFGVLIVGLIINVLAPAFCGGRDSRQAFKVAAYSLTPASLSSVLALAPPILATLLQLLAGLYGVYMLHLGLPVLMRSAPKKAFGYTASVVSCTILVGVVFAVLSSVYDGAQPK